MTLSVSVSYKIFYYLKRSHYCLFLKYLYKKHLIIDFTAEYKDLKKITDDEAECFENCNKQSMKISLVYLIA